MKPVEEQLASQGLRLAACDEPGWYVMVELDGGGSGRVWATDTDDAKTWREAILSQVRELGEVSVDAIHEGAENEDDLEEAYAAVDALVADGTLTDRNGVLVLKGIAR